VLQRNTYKNNDVRLRKKWSLKKKTAKNDRVEEERKQGKMEGERGKGKTRRSNPNHSLRERKTE
jgi:hypothetical protein